MASLRAHIQLKMEGPLGCWLASSCCSPDVTQVMQLQTSFQNSCLKYKLSFDNAQLSTSLHCFHLCMSLAMSIYTHSIETSGAEHVPVTRSMRRIVASRYIRSIDICPHSILDGSFLPKLTSFSIFRNLPLELRAQIWTFAFEEPHIVELELLTFMNTTSVPPPRSSSWSFRNTTPHPLLSTCTESREEVLKRYRSSEHSRYNSLPINFAINSLFLKDLNFGSIQGYWLRNVNYVKSGDCRALLPSIFECVESLVISRTSILNAECEAENIIRYCFPNLCLLIITVNNRVRNELSSNRTSQFLLHPEDDHHISLLSFAPTTCHWDAIYASRIKVNMQRRFARQERIHRDYVAPVVKVVSAGERYGET